MFLPIIYFATFHRFPFYHIESFLVMNRQHKWLRSHTGWKHLLFPKVYHKYKQNTYVFIVNACCTIPSSSDINLTSLCCAKCQKFHTFQCPGYIFHYDYPPGRLVPLTPHPFQQCHSHVMLPQCSTWEECFWKWKREGNGKRYKPVSTEGKETGATNYPEWFLATFHITYVQYYVFDGNSVAHCAQPVHILTNPITMVCIDHSLMVFTGVGKGKGVQQRRNGSGRVRHLAA